MPKKPEMTSKERMMTTLRNGQPDRIPVAPDISNMIPCRLTGKPYWEVYINNNPPLWKAYIDAVKFFSMDGWFTYGALNFTMKSRIIPSSRIIKGDEAWIQHITYQTPDGDLSETFMSPSANPILRTEKMIKNFKEDFKKIRHLFSEPVSYEDSFFREQKKELGDSGIMCIGIFPPGMQIYVEYFQGSLEAATYAYYDEPELFMELCELHEKQSIRMLEMAIDAGTESVLTGGSGSITLQSPELWRKFSLPAIKKITRMCKEAGVISGIHSCGREEYLIKTCCEETDLDYVNPLEIPPMGDCSLADCKEKYGKRIALMGNLHTTEVMLLGTPEKVRLESLKAIRDAGAGGGFVLSTGDQCGRDTPYENIYALVDTAKEYGTYPLDMDRIETEINRLI